MRRGILPADMNRARSLLSFVLALALFAGQWAGQLHVLAHAQQDLALAAGLPADGGTQLPADHTRERCIALHAVDCALDVFVPAVVAASPVPAPRLIVRVPLHRPADPPYSSRAPPVLLSLT